MHKKDNGKGGKRNRHLIITIHNRTWNGGLMANPSEGSMRHLLCRRGLALRGGYYKFGIRCSSDWCSVYDVMLLKKSHGTMSSLTSENQ